MSLKRAATPLATALRSSFSAQSRTRICPLCLYRASSSHDTSIPSRRRFVTASEHRPVDLHPPPTPPRNLGVPETSIAGLGQKPREERREAQTRQDADQAKSRTILSEAEAQRSQPTKNAASGNTVAAPSPSPSSSKPTSSTTPATPRKSKLRARKAAMTLSSRAVEALRDLLEQPDPKLIRVGVKNRGCSGLAYHLEYVEKPGPFDETVEQDGVKVLIDSKALFSIIGSEMDWVEDKLSQRFVFKNPNISKFCARRWSTNR